MLIIILIVLIILYKFILHSKKYNIESKIISLDKLNYIKGEDLFNPHIFNHKFSDINLSTIIQKIPNNYYFLNDKLIRINDFILNDKYIYKNQKLSHDLDLNTTGYDIFNYFKTNISFNTNHSLSLIKGNYNTNIKKNKNNITLLNILNGQCTVYIINPKHDKDIQSLNFNKIKKWSITLSLHSHQILYIPTNWFYIIEVNKECIILHTESDTYFTSIYNIIRD